MAAEASFSQADQSFAAWENFILLTEPGSTQAKTILAMGEGVVPTHSIAEYGELLAYGSFIMGDDKDKPFAASSRKELQVNKSYIND